jgi:hypothetical protein
MDFCKSLDTTLISDSQSFKWSQPVVAATLPASPLANPPAIAHLLNHHGIFS